MVYRKKARWLILLLSLSVLAATSVWSASRNSDKGKLAKATTDTDMGFFNGNRIWSYLENDGTIVTDDYDGNSGMYWPSRSSLKTLNYCSGVWVAGKVGKDAVTACAEYASEWAPGVVLSSGLADNKDDAKYKLYKINKGDALSPQEYPDWMNWPVAQGAPWIDNNANGVYEPLAGDTPDIMGDQMIWYVMNDLNTDKHHNVFSTNPIGLQCKVTIWGYNRPDEFGDMMFAKFQLYNVRNTKVDSCYLGVWADVDMGNGNDDFVACDTTLSLGYTYNDGDDGVYGVAAPVVGYDFFQGAIVKGLPTDTAKAFGKRIPGYKNMGMSGFTKYINAGGDMYGDPETGQDCWNYMSGLTRSGAKYKDPTTGKYVYPCKYGSGDPVKGTGWLDKMDHASGDRRQLISCGPFVLAPGDSQEVVTACIIAQGADQLLSITRLKEADKKAQIAYDIDFTLPPAPSVPKVAASGVDKAIYLTWDGSAESYEAEDLVDVDENGDPSYYTFQGYNVYQMESATGIGVVKKIATFDKVDLIQDIKDFEFVGAIGENVEHVVQKGTDTGVKRFFGTTNDAINGGTPLVNNRPYYFAVTAFGYNEIGIPKTLESPKVVVTVYPQQAFGKKVQATYDDTLAVTHTGPSQGVVTAIVVDPGQITGHDYKVTFKTVSGQTLWDLANLSTGKVVLPDQTNQAGDDEVGWELVEGLQVQVSGPSPGVNFDKQDPALTPAGYEASCWGWGITPADNANRWITGYNPGLTATSAFFGGIFNGYDYWGVYADRYTDCKLEFIKDPGPDSSNWTKAYVLRRDKAYAFETIGWFPGKLWNIDNPAKPEQLNIAFVEDSRLAPANKLWDMGWDPVTQTYANNSTSGNQERIWLLDSKYDAGTSETLKNLDWYDGTGTGLMYHLFPTKRGTTKYCSADFSIYIFASKINTSKDVFTFSTKDIRADINVMYAKEDVKRINVFPNPYFGANVEEVRTLQHFVRFTHLPPKAALRIYTLAGELVRTLQHDDGTQFEEWDLQNEFDIPVASGIYLVHIDCGVLGEKVLKVALIMAEERLRQF